MNKREVIAQEKLQEELIYIQEEDRLCEDTLDTYLIAYWPNNTCKNQVHVIAVFENFASVIDIETYVKGKEIGTVIKNALSNFGTDVTKSWRTLFDEKIIQEDEHFCNIEFMSI